MTMNVSGTGMYYVTDGLTHKNKEGNLYTSYHKLDGVKEIQKRLVTDENGNSLGCVDDLVNEYGTVVATLGSESGEKIYTAEEVLGKKLNVEA